MNHPIAKLRNHRPVRSVFRAHLPLILGATTMLLGVALIAGSIIAGATQIITFAGLACFGLGSGGVFLGMAEPHRPANPSLINEVTAILRTNPEIAAIVRGWEESFPGELRLSDARAIKECHEELARQKRASELSAAAHNSAA